MNYLKRIEQKLEKIRKLKGFSQEYMANRLKISQNSYSKIERGEMKITFKKLNEICNVLEIDMNALKNFDPFKEIKQLSETESTPALISLIITSLDKVTKLYEDLLMEKNARIEDLERIILILRQSENS